MPCHSVYKVPDRVRCEACCTLVVHTAGRPCVRGRACTVSLRPPAALVRHTLRDRVPVMQHSVSGSSAHPPHVRCAPCGERGVKPHQAAAATCGSRRARAPTPPAAAGAIRTAFEFFSQRAANGFAVPEWAPTPGNAAYAAAVRRLDRAVYGVIDRRAAELAAAPGPPQARPQGVVGATVKADPGPRRRRMSRNRKPEAGRAGR